MPCQIFREREGIAHEAGESLAERVVESLDVTAAVTDVVGLPTSLADGFVEFLGQHVEVDLVEVRVGVQFAVGFGHSVPQEAAGRLAAVADRIGNDLPGSAAQHQPDPRLVRFALDIRPRSHTCEPHLVELQNVLVLSG